MKKIFLVYTALFFIIFCFSCREIMESQPWQVYNCKKSNKGIFPKKSIREPILHNGYPGKLGFAIFVDTTYNFESCTYYTVYMREFLYENSHEFNASSVGKGDTLIRNAGSDTITIRHEGLNYRIVCELSEAAE